MCSCRYSFAGQQSVFQELKFIFSSINFNIFLFDSTPACGVLPVLLQRDVLGVFVLLYTSLLHIMHEHLAL
jgi:hypothetical protein